ncbi:CC0125/CC1285 family lipoprotein [Hahella ganghwensis]|uniref:CC0125/CC1285 family lipoprotein n=1 Tax=Hahella ganghwensis TaxID=286420 RepID=UPI00039F6994|nr:hypothetical protein [Hahella ganghwensis]
MRLLFVAGVLIWLAGCSAFESRPLYMAKEGKRPHGYSEIQLSERYYQVTYETYENVSFADAEKFALKRAAELSVSQEASGFDVLEKACFNDYLIEESAEIAPSQRTATFSSDAGPISIPIDEPYFPSVTHTYEVKKCVLKVELLDSL